MPPTLPDLFHSGSSNPADGWTPLRYTLDGAEHEFGEYTLLRERGSEGSVLQVGVWRCDKPGDTPFASEDGDETFLLLEGELTITEVASGRRHHYRTGDICTWTKGTRTVWTLTVPVRKMFVIADPASVSP
ncbi:cupin domain-containing protein [Derxia lacustris]|uniref:cupin domain-containing protein n=1 Tax=Derxia lacustris TaxID=764842 RepID=UPI000A1753E8|nr:cupin domain-containing protein [Derxia lacustris]